MRTIDQLIQVVRGRFFGSPRPPFTYDGITSLLLEAYESGCDRSVPAGQLEIVFDGPPSHESGRFVECEVDGKSVNAGDWIERSDGLWALRLFPRSMPAEVVEVVEALRPFAHIAEWSDEDTRWAITRNGWVRSITGADLQRARAALAALNHEQPAALSGTPPAQSAAGQSPPLYQRSGGVQE